MKRLKPMSGFTLIEVLIAMTLLSVMVVLLFASLRICGQSWEKGESKMGDVNEMAVVYHFFKQHLSTAKPSWDTFSVKDQRTLAFQGAEQSLQFVGEFPASAGKAGDQLFTLAIKELEDGQAINVTLAPFLPSANGGELPKEEIILIKHVRKLSFAYFGPDPVGGEANWQTQWSQREAQPQLVKIGIELDSDIYWPDMIVALKVASSEVNMDNANMGGMNPNQQNNQNNRAE